MTSLSLNIDLSDQTVNPCNKSSCNFLHLTIIDSHTYFTIEHLIVFTFFA